MKNVTTTSLLLLAAAAALVPSPAAGRTLAVVGGKALTEADVLAVHGYLPQGPELRETVEGLVQREIVLALARGKALGASAGEIDRAAALAVKAFRPPFPTNSEGYRRRLGEEITIAKYLDRYVYPRVAVTEEALRAYFAARPGEFMKRPPRDREALGKLFPRYRNEVLYLYVKAEMRRLLAEAVREARPSLNVEIYVD
ncbi:MAG: hypothetical protein JSU81_07110 [Candidatus Coatesbacteria bacterium]|nr:MAG: hypothetical protein JSU81_07110 [Candidatus Coatesbacteria bacterium]